METVLLDFDRVKILDPQETESVFIALQSMRNVWLQRTNWHPALEIAGPDSNLEKYIHYYTVGATLYMDARDRGWEFYKKMHQMYNRVLKRKLGWLYDKFLIELEDQLEEKKVEVQFGETVRKYLAKKGFDPLMGARPMQRLIQDSIRKILADELLFGKLKNGGSVKIEFDEQSEKIFLKWPKSNGNARQDTKTSPESIEI